MGIFFGFKEMEEEGDCAGAVSISRVSVVPTLYYSPIHFQNAGLKLLAYSHRYIEEIMQKFHNFKMGGGCKRT